MFPTTYPFRVPWFLLDISNFQLITTPTIPGDIRDSKEIVLAETPVPGLNYRPVLPGGGGNRKIGFTLKLIRRRDPTGNILLLKQFEMLRNRTSGLLGRQRWGGGRFSGMPKVLYYWGTGSLPLVYWVSKCDATHKHGWVNEFGAPQVSELEMELILDEENPLYLAEEAFRVYGSIAGMALQGYDAVQSIQQGLRRPY
jgi:hypothetical protein